MYCLYCSVSAMLRREGLRGKAATYVASRLRRRQRQTSKNIDDLLLRAASLHSAHLEDNSINEYLQCGADLHAFALRAGLPLAPVSARLLTAYVMDWIERGNSPKTLHGRFSGIRWYLRTRYGRDDLFLDRRDPAAYDSVLRLIRAGTRTSGRRRKKANPLYQPIIDKIFAKWKLDRPIVPPRALWQFQIAVWAQCLHHFSQRSGELLGAGVTWASIQIIARPATIVFHYTETNNPKMHKESQAPYAVASASHPTYRRLLHYASVFQPKSQQDLLFPHVSMVGTVQWGRPMSRDVALARLRQLIQAIGLKNVQGYSGHAGRRGAVSERNDSIPSRLLNLQGHWNPNSQTMHQDYDCVPLHRRRQHF